MASRTAADNRLELTWRGVVLGAAITLVFTAANIYLGLKVGLTFASSIPAAVISMAVLRGFKNATIFENNIVQTIASAAGTLSSIIFVLPGLIMVGWWTHFPFWESFSVCVIGGVLGVMYSVPLRRALVTNSDLPYPEGRAAAEVLKVGVGARSQTQERVDENKQGLIALVLASVVSAGYALIVAARVFTDTLAGYFRVGSAATGFGVGMSLALVGAGHLIGLSVGLAILAGLVLAWGILTPLLTALHPAAGAAGDVALAVWAQQVRFIGAGTIGIAAIWSLTKLMKPVYAGITSSIAASRRLPAQAGELRELPRPERDLPINIVAIISLACFIPLAALLAIFLSGTAIASLTVPLVIAGLLYIVVAGFFVASACGYMAGLIGSSNSPVSGLGILSVIGAALILLAVAKSSGATGVTALVAYALFVTAVLLNIATISNDNLQDLKTGQLVDATPWRQQVSLICGVVFGAAVIPPILDLLNKAYGFGAGPHSLPAPQATLISALAKGVIQGQIRWDLIGIGAAIGVVVIFADEMLRARTSWQLPPLAVGLGIYLPAATTSAAVVGAVIGWAYNRSVQNSPNGDIAKRMGVLIASGMIVGESLFGVLLAGTIVASGKATPFAIVGDAFQPLAMLLAAIGFAVAIYWLYRWSARAAQRLGTS
ncbi:MAG: oligopeptide transporter, OPT family [Candidatus Eremiobacteraeota bacterium]|nr:oligopeptide transporter, OPT family [Candidatus Eremiobacteraeota bacterium]MBC5826793.1 oligopeptide transporter, OPT family [Candidatus Eremiobacteraeota bacterium]